MWDYECISVACHMQSYVELCTAITKYCDIEHV